MTRLITVSIALNLLFPAARAANVLFGAYSTASCEECLDQTFESCPGDYTTRSYAECMCAGDGGANFVSCMSECDTELNEPANASSAWYGYCVQFFKEMCPEAEKYLDEEDFNEECSPDAIAAGGLGSSTASETMTSANPTAPTESTSGTATHSETTAQSTSGAIASAAPALAIIAGLGMQLVNINL
ncbi:hypothetical protein BGZ63DRAFT_418111 [Mariannaea sp. PMI_226]|nr:hypothetical protein BGZ63DRAFT_418111 [Mariannaea sp. PMI_226]